MQFTLGNHTSIGKVRTANEDAFGNWITPNGHLFVVCDGMGGHIGGAIASQAAASAIYQTMASQKFPSGPIALEYCLEEANRKLHHIVAGNPSLHGMGTTAVAVLLQDDAAYFAHIGDSRLYLFRQNNLRRLTRDHSFVQSLVDRGQISEEEAEAHPRRNEIYRALGIDETVEPTVSASPVMLQPGDRLLLCTDGLNGMIGDKGIAGVMATRGLTVQQQAEKLVALADEAGGHDNTTVQIVLMRPTPKPSIGEVASAGAIAAAPATPPTETPLPPSPASPADRPPAAAETPLHQNREEKPQRPKELFLQPVEEKKPRKPLLPIIGGIILFIALILLLYNFLRSPDAPRLGVEEPVNPDTATIAPMTGPESAPAQGNDTPVAVTPPPAAPAPRSAPSDSIRRKASATPDTAKKAATTPVAPAMPPKKDSSKKIAPKVSAPTPPARPATTDTAHRPKPKAVMPPDEPAP